MAKIDEVKEALGDLQGHLNYAEVGNYIVMKPTHFLGSDMFSEIIKKIRSIGGEYISAGKESHFRVPLANSTAKESSGSDKTAKIREARDLIEKALTILTKEGY